MRCRASSGTWHVLKVEPVPLLHIQEGIQRLVDDANRLEPQFLNIASGQE